MTRFYFIAILIIISININQSVEAQRGMGGPGGGGPEGNFAGGNKNSVTGQISGALVDSLKNPVEFDSTKLYQADSYDPVTGVITDEKGEFLLRNIPIGNYTLEISYIGFKKIRITNINMSFENRDINLGNIMLLPSQEKL